VSISRIKYQYQDNDKEGNQNCQAYHANAEIAKLARLIMQMLKLPSSSINIKISSINIKTR
jgi:hypothetical protein